MPKLFSVSRRELITRLLTAGGGLGITSMLAACSGSKLPEGNANESPPEPDGTESGAASVDAGAGAPGTAAGSSPEASTSNPGNVGDTAAVPPGDVLDSPQALAVSFSYVVDTTASSGGGGGGGRGGRIRNPYIAVWIENADGDAVRTIELSFQQDRKGRRWLNDLKRWFRQDQQRMDAGGADIIDTVSGATRVPGEYSVLWDMKNEEGSVQPLGDYFVCVEAAREHGPYSMVREPLTLDGTPFSKTLSDDGELHALTVELRAV